MYKQSIYNIVEKKIRPDHISTHMVPHQPNVQQSIFAHYLVRYYSIYFSEFPSRNSYPMFVDGFVDKIKSNELELYVGSDDNVLMENVVLEYLHDKLDINHDLLDRLNSSDIYPDLRCYALLPLIIFILKEHKKKLTLRLDVRGRY